MPALIIKAPAPLPPSLSSPTIFLSGTISPPPTPTWQSTLSTSLSHLAVTILNPLRPDWDASWRENRSDARFVAQVNWELDGLERADVVVVYFGSEAKAPITLLELGLVVGRGKRVVVCCEDGFWKRGNVELLCEKMEVACVGSLEEMRRVVVGMLGELGVSVDG